MTSSKQSLMNRTALVTGANRGIGLAVAHDLARRGVNVLMGSRDAVHGAKGAEEVRAAGGKAEVVELDVADPSSIRNCVTEIEQRKIAVDILVNNAGVYSSGDALAATPEDYRHTMEVNLFGPMLLCQLLVPTMVRRDWGRVVNVSTGYASLTDGLDGPATYCVSKVALTALTVKMAQAAGSSVRVNAVSPGWVRTRMGGMEADLSHEEGAERVMWGVLIPDDGPTGCFVREGKVAAW